MKKLKEFLYREINIRNSYLIGISLLILLICISTTSYALFTATAEKKGALNIVTGNLYALIKSDSLDENKQVIINPNETKTLKIELTNVNSIDAKFIMYYKTDTNTISIGCTENSDICPIEEGIVLTKNGTEKDTVTFTTQITNNGTKKATITFGANVGFPDKEISLVSGQNKILKTEPVVEEKNAAKMLKEKASVDRTPENEKEIQEITHDENKKEYRYIGKNPNNYIKYNEEMWRIIGVFETENKNGAIEQRIKIIRDESIGLKKWSDDNKNSWKESTLRENLNSNELYDLLNDKAKDQIDDAKWYLGNVEEKLSQTEEIYRSERETNKNELTWIGRVGLLYPSDFGYTFAKGVETTCFDNLKDCTRGKESVSWLYRNENQWTITSLKDNENNIITISNTGDLTNARSDSEEHSVRPVVYLKYDIDIKQGTGTLEDPYIIE